MKKVDYLIVGGGIVGIAAAKLLEERGSSYILVESEPRLGGLLKTENYDGYDFDYGTHLITETGVEHIDNLIIGALDKDHWNQYEYLKAGCYYRKLDQKSPVISVDTALSERDKYQGFFELVNTISHDKVPSNLSDQHSLLFGDLLSKKITLPVLEHLYKTPSLELAPNAGALFGVSRLKFFDNDVSQKIKKISELDQRIAFESSKYNLTGIKSFYPKFGGIEKVITSLEKGLSEQSVYKNTKVVSVVDQGEEFNIDLGREEKVVAGKIIWTLPAIYLLNMLDENYKSAYRPKFLKTKLFHLVLDKKPLTKLHYFYSYNVDDDIFRTTFYSNMAGNDEYKVTCEVLFSDQTNEDVAGVLQHLIKSRAFSEDTSILYSKVVDLGFSFPILTNDFQLNLAEHRQHLEKNSRILLGGKARGDLFFTNDLLMNLFNGMENF